MNEESSDSRESEGMNDEGEARAVVAQCLLQGWPRVSAIWAHGIQESLNHHRTSDAPAVSKPIVLGRNRNLGHSGAAPTTKQEEGGGGGNKQ